MSTILITGGTGLVGTALRRLLTENGYHVIILSRNPPPKDRPTQVAGSPADTASVTTYHWDPSTGAIDPDAIRLADHIIHLAGAGVADARWAKKRKQEILESRINGCATLVKAL